MPFAESVRYEGRVQGVGFRYTAASIARDFRISGLVRNESDGSVYLEASGEEDEVRRFFSAIRNSGIGRLIENEYHGPLLNPEKTNGFEIRYR